MAALIDLEVVLEEQVVVELAELPLVVSLRQRNSKELQVHDSVE